MAAPIASSLPEKNTGDKLTAAEVNFIRTVLLAFKSVQDPATNGLSAAALPPLAIEGLVPGAVVGGVQQLVFDASLANSPGFQAAIAAYFQANPGVGAGTSGTSSVTLALTATVGGTAKTSPISLTGGDDSVTFTLAPSPSGVTYSSPILRLISGPKGAGGAAGQGFWGNDGVVAESPRASNYYAGMVAGNYVFEAQITVNGTVVKSATFPVSKA